MQEDIESATKKLKEEFTDISRSYKCHPFGSFPGDKKETRRLKTLSKKAVRGLEIEKDLGRSAQPVR